jgi:KDO2-lipid IV(A) lauroyltransferase
MWSKLLHYLLLAALWLINLAPRLSLFILKPIVFFLLYRVIGYRKKIVKSNMLRCFSYSSSELNKHVKQFYKHLSGLLIEPFLTQGLSEKYLSKRVVFKNELTEQYHKEGRMVFLAMGHMGNWEWLGTIAPAYTSFDTSIVYQKLSNPNMEKYINKSRGKYGTACIEMREVLRFLIEAKKKPNPTVMSFLGDQVPNSDKCAIVDFFGESMYFYDGYEKLAKRLGAVVLYVHSEIIDNTYVYTPELINDFKLTPNYDKTVADYAKLLEGNIRKQPYNWLWSHRRWKRMPN